MSTSASAFGAEATGKPTECSPAEVLATLGVSAEEFGIHQEQMRRSFHSPPATHLGYYNKSLPFPLNIPPSYSTHPSASASSALARHLRLRRGASVMPDPIPQPPQVALEVHTRAPSSIGASFSKGKGKRSLDAFMDSRQVTRVQETDSSGSESDTPIIKRLSLPVEDSQDSALPSSSPPSSSPLHTPRESSPLRMMYAYPSSPTPRPKRQSSVRVDTPDTSYTLPPGPYSREKPSWSLAALIGQAINASHSGALPLNDIYCYISTVYPHFNRRDQPWMSSIRHSLSVNDAFERVPDLNGNTSRKGRGKGMTRLKGGLWRIKPDHLACFEGGNFIRKGAKGAGPGKNLGGRKRLRDDDEERSDKKSKAKGPSPSLTGSFSHSDSAIASTSSHPLPQTTRGSERRTISPPAPADNPSQKSLVPTASAPSSLRPLALASESSSQDTHFLPPSHMLAETSSSVPGMTDRALILTLAGRNSTRPHTSTPASSLEPGFKLEMKNGQQSLPEISGPQTSVQEVNHELFSRVFSRTSSACPSSPRAGPSDPSKTPRLLFPPPFPSSPLPGSSSSPIRPITPPSLQNSYAVTLSPARTPMSHRGLHMSPSRSLAHYKSSFEPEWKSASRPTTPPLRDQHCEGEDTIFSTPKRPSFPSTSLQISPFRTPAGPSRPRNGQGYYDPYDPNTLLADELASIKNASELQESPGGFFGKEGRKLLYESPSVPGQSDWRFKDEF
ncbi:hypothetical protein JB92DRAFT_2881461 [Gautieria morchelliformis]|nr:hypothetical protein JB92DRAFT_2881461 [Gautieria morchelliformis]